MSLNASHDSTGCDGQDGQKAGQEPSRLSAIFNTIMTPVHFTAFVVSLFIIDWWHTVLRSYTHSQSPAASRLPGWLYALIYKEQPYAYGPAGRDGDRDWHYHSKQKSLMRMEAEEAFRLRKTVVVGMVVGAMLTVTSIWTTSRYVFRYGQSFLA